LLELRAPVFVITAVIIGLISHAAMYGPQAAFFAELFGTRVRYSGASLGYQLASPLAGGLAPLVATALLNWSGGKPWPVALYLIGMSSITVLSVWFTKETHSDSL
jgi:MHS family shikimate/dehydroshikimate transporter-like MFS transporter